MKINFKNSFTPEQEAAFLIVQFMSVVVKKDVAKQCAIKHCDNMLDFIDSKMQGWLDSDLKGYYENVKESIKIA